MSSCGRSPLKPLYCMYLGSDANHHTKDCPIFLESKRKMEHDCNQHPPQSSSREVNNTMQWEPPHQPYSPSYPSLFSQPSQQNHQGLFPSYYQSYHYITTNHTQPFPLPQITYPLPLPQITYPPTNNRTKQPKTEPNLPPPPPQQSNNFPMHDTIQAITEGSNTDFENKRK
jgi:hypothetical protein